MLQPLLRPAAVAANDRLRGASPLALPAPPLLDLDFVGRPSLQYPGLPPLTFARADAATSATYRDVNGDRKMVGANAPRFDHSIAGVPLGLLMELPRTNYLLNSRAPATQTTGSLATGDYILWCEGPGSAAVAGTTATIIGASGLDYRVIMLATHGNVSFESICVSAPLSGTDCVTIPAQPAENPPIFYHHSAEIASNDAWCKLLQHYDAADTFGLHPNGFKDFLRPEASKTIVVITDDNVSCTWNGVTYSDGNTAASGDASAQLFDASLLALSPTQFGTIDARNYVFHSIVAMAPFDPNDLTLPHPPDAPVITAECSPGAQDPGTGYQALSVLTGGLRYPTCGNDYTTIFNQIAVGVIEGAKVDCEFPVPTPPVGETIDLSTVAVVYTPGDGSAPKTYTQVADATLCGPGLFYIENDTIKLCQETCDEVQADGEAAVKIISGCEPGEAT